MRSLLALALVGGIAYALSQKSDNTQQTGQSSVSSGSGGYVPAPVSSSASPAPALSEIAQKVASGQVVYNDKGIVVANALNEKGQPRITQEAQVYNIKVREGAATEITPNLNNNPLDVGYKGVSGQTYVSTRTAANATEARQAAQANIAGMVKSGQITQTEANNINSQWGR